MPQRSAFSWAGVVDGISAVAGMKWVVAAIAGIWMTIPAAVQMLIVLMAIDYATGLLCAWLRRQLSAAASLRGLVRKTLTLLLVITAHYATRAMHLGFDLGAMVAMGYSVNEFISIVENAAVAGVPIPEPLLDAMVRAKKLAGRNKAAKQVKKELDA